MTLSSPHVPSPQMQRMALSALRAGISCIPIIADGSKRPAIAWKEYQSRCPTIKEVRRWFTRMVGIALVTGAVSGGLELLDFDSRPAYEAFVQRVKAEDLAPLFARIERGYREDSPRGVHLYYRCALVEGSKKLAQAVCPGPAGVSCLIETRGEGGYSIAAPSPGYRRVYGSLATIPIILPEERALLFSIARTLDALPQAVSPSVPRHPSPRQRDARLPGTRFNERASWAEILEPHGWRCVRTIGEEVFWCRPGKQTGISATTNYQGSGYLYVFSTSTRFEPRVGISKFAAYTLLNHDGDFSAAAKALAAGDSPEENSSL